MICGEPRSHESFGLVGKAQSLISDDLDVS